MAPINGPVFDLNAPFQKGIIKQVRTSKMQPMRNLSIETGIYKQPRAERVFCSRTGLESDEHDLTFHGGVDKAVHQYFPGHYPSWQAEFPESAEHFQVGAFGENLVVENGLNEGSMNERNVCIGDVYRIGGDPATGKGGVLLQVSLPRQPCFKLNHRFNLKNFTSQTWKKSRTGWYYRVLEEGWVGVGDEMVLVERNYPEWCIERVQEYLHRDKKNLEKLEELAKIEVFGAECKRAFKRSIDTEKKARETRGVKTKEEWTEFKIVEKRVQAPRIASFTLQSVSQPKESKELDPGSFVRLKLPNGLLRSYSVVKGSTDKFMLGIALDDQSRGGSRYLHTEANEGDKLLVGKFTEGVPFIESASNHIFIVGGIGITAFLAHVDIFSQINYNYTFHYAVRSAEDVPFKEELQKMGSRLVLYDRSKGQRMDISSILKERTWNSFVYTCGPQRMADEVLRASLELGISQDEIHYEAFQTITGGDPFEVELAGSKRVLQVAGDQTLLEVLREAGLEVDSSCETGNCGTCRVEVCKGNVEHRGSALNEEDKKNGGMLSCVSRGIGQLVLDF